MKRIIPLLLCIISLSGLAQKKTAVDARLTGLDAKLQAILAEWKVAGFAVAIVDKKKVIYAKGFGYSDYEKKIPATANTLFAIGSCSKAFTCSLLGLLRQDGKIDFDQSPRNYLPGLQFFNSEMNSTITVRDMMCHRTGLPRHDYSWYLFNTESRDTLLQRIQFQEPTFGVRQRWQYNNFMFMAQGMITEKITGKTWEDNVREKIFQPLGMSRSNLSIEELEKSTDASKGYEVKNDKEIVRSDYYHIRAMAPAGSINSSVSEMANWVITWINGGKFEGKELLPASYVQEAISSQMVITAALPTKEHPDIQFANYGYGWFNASYKGHYRVEHGGNIDGFSASTSFFPSDSVGIVVLVNQNGSPVPSIVRNTIADRLLGVQQTDWSKELKETAEKNKQAAKDVKKGELVKKNTKPSHLPEDLRGKYTHPGYGSFVVAVKNDSLFATMPKGKFWLKHRHYNTFQPYEVGAHGIDTTNAAEVNFNFFVGDAGEIESALVNGLEAGLKPFEFKRQPTTVSVSGDDLKKYVGEFELGGIVAKVYMKGDKTLHLFVPGQPEYELLPLGDHKFAIKDLSGFKVEFTAVAGAFDEVVFRQPNGVFTAKRKK